MFPRRTNILLFVLIALFSSCSLTKKVSEGEYLLTKNVIYEDGKKLNVMLDDDEPYQSIFQKENKKFLLFFPFRLWFYNAANDRLQKPLTQWYELTDSHRTEGALDSLLLHDSLLDWTYDERAFFLKGIRLHINKVNVKNQEPPVLLDTFAAHRSEQTLKNFYGFKRGYLAASVQSEVKKNGKKAKVIYHISRGNPYILDSLIYNISDSTIKQLYLAHPEDSSLRIGAPFSDTSFEDEKKRIAQLLRNSGYYDFSEANIQMEADSTYLGNNRIAGIIHIGPLSENDPYNKIYTISAVNVYDTPASGLQSSGETHTVDHQSLRIHYQNGEQYRPQVYEQAIVIKKDAPFSAQDAYQTKYNFNRLKNFTIPDVRYRKDSLSENTLIANIYTQGLKKYGLSIGLDAYTSEYLTIGISPQFSLLSRNIFRGAENLEISLNLTGGTVKQIDNNSGLAVESSLTSKLNFPRIIFPFFNMSSLLDSEDSPQTYFGLNFSWQNNIGLGRTTYSSFWGYTWSVNKIINHKIEASNFQYIRNSNKENYFNLYTSDAQIRDTMYQEYFEYNPALEPAYENGHISDDQMSMIIVYDPNFKSSSYYDSEVYSSYLDMLQRENRITEDVLINSSAYTFEYNQSLNPNIKNPFFFRGKIELAGNTLYLLDQLIGFKKDTGAFIYENQILGVGYAQFAKIDLDVRKYWRLDNKTKFVSRLFLGISLPYGNAESAPFSRVYFSGGSSDIRAWKAYDLGPGGVNRANQSFASEHLKITASVEYRKNLTTNLEAALFLDTGNIWAVRKTARPESRFYFNDFYQQLALGGGLGIRYDFGYDIVLRADLAYKMHDPNNPVDYRWFEDFKVFKPLYNIGIGYPF